MTREHGLGLVGAGRFGEFCVEAVRDLPGVRVVAVMDADRARAEAVAPTGAAVYDDFDALLADPSVDIVHVGTPPFLHGSMARRAAERGKHVFVEKPLATTLEDARAAVDAAIANGVQLSIDYVLRHHPLHRLAIELARSKALGDLQQFALENFASSGNLPPDHWFWDRMASGGIHVEHGVHFFDLCLALVGTTPDSVMGTAHARADGRVDRVTATLGFGDRAVATFYHSFNRTADTEWTTIRLAFALGRVTIQGWIPTTLEMTADVPPAAMASLRDLFGEALRTRDGVAPHAVAPRGMVHVEASAAAPDRQDQYRRAVRAGLHDLTAAIGGIRPLRITAEDGLRSLEIALRASL
jgi:predicted dehydrogenase